MGDHAFRLLAQGEQGARFFHQAGSGEGGLEIRRGHGYLHPDSRHFEMVVKPPAT